MLTRFQKLGLLILRWGYCYMYNLPLLWNESFTGLYRNNSKSDRYYFIASFSSLTLVGIGCLYGFLTFFLRENKSFYFATACVLLIFSFAILIALSVVLILIQNPEIVEGFNTLIRITSKIVNKSLVSHASHEKTFRLFEVCPIIVSFVVVPEPFFIMVMVFYFKIEPFGLIFGDMIAAFGMEPTSSRHFPLFSTVFTIVRYF